MAGIEDFVNTLQKKFGKEVVAGNNTQGVEFVSSGSLSLDLALGGGYALGRIIELRGYESSGKTTLALTACKNIQEQTGKAVLYIDRENAIDMDYVEARKLLGDNKIIGMTATSVSLAKKAEKLGADYIGAGAVFSTNTKKDTKPLELSTLKEICNSVSIPVVAIGGIDHSNVRELKGTDIDGVAVISALFGASDPGEATRELVSIMKDVIK